MRTRLQGGYVVGYDGREHEILDGGCVIYEGDRILFVGFPDDPDCPVADRTVLLPDSLISPGLINLHCIANIDVQPLRIDVGNVGFPRSKAWFEADDEILSDEAFEVSARFSVAALLRHGSTTFCTVTTMASKRYEDPTYEPFALARAAETLGARAYIAHNFQDHSRFQTPDEETHVVPDRERGHRGLEHAVELVQKLRSAHDDRIRGFLFPYTTDTCTDELLLAASSAARELGVPMRSHFAQYPYETVKELERYGRTPVERLHGLGILGPELTLTHAIYLGGHPEVPDGDMDSDLQLLVQAGTSVAHCPVVFSRRGTLLRSFGRYRDAGVNLALGTDTVPPDILGEMRMASTLAKIADSDPEAGSVEDVFAAATLGGARALGRDDLGKLTPGAKADISVFRIKALHIGVVDCPLKALVHYGNGGDTEMVIVDGTTVVEDGAVVGVDERELLAQAQEVWSHYMQGLVARDPLGRHARDLYPRAVSVRHA